MLKRHRHHLTEHFVLSRFGAARNAKATSCQVNQLLPLASQLKTRNSFSTIPHATKTKSAIRSVQRQANTPCRTQESRITEKRTAIHHTPGNHTFGKCIKIRTIRTYVAPFATPVPIEPIKHSLVHVARKILMAPNERHRLVTSLPVLCLQVYTHRDSYRSIHINTSLTYCSACSAPPIPAGTSSSFSATWWWASSSPHPRGYKQFSSPPTASISHSASVGSLRSSHAQNANTWHQVTQLIGCCCVSPALSRHV